MGQRKICQFLSIPVSHEEMGEEDRGGEDKTGEGRRGEKKRGEERTGQGKEGRGQELDYYITITCVYNQYNAHTD